MKRVVRRRLVVACTSVLIVAGMVGIVLGDLVLVIGCLAGATAGLILLTATDP